MIPSRRSLVHQREIGVHTHSFADGLRAALREDPDVIVVGELRDLAGIALAIRAAETGHLVLGTLHTGDTSQAVTRVLDVFDSVSQNQIRIQLAQSLQAVITQRLRKRLTGKQWSRRRRCWSRRRLSGTSSARTGPRSSGAT